MGFGPMKTFCDAHERAGGGVCAESAGGPRVR
jgi:hypothetical protein